MVAPLEFEVRSEHLSEQVHDFQAAGDLCKTYLSNTAPSASLDSVKTDLAEIAAGNGYVAGGSDVQNDTSRSGAVTSVTGVDVTETASGGAINTFRYVVLYNDTPTSPADPLLQSWDNGSAVDLADGESFTEDFGASLFTVTS